MNERDKNIYLISSQLREFGVSDDLLIPLEYRLKELFEKEYQKGYDEGHDEGYVDGLYEK